MNMAYYQKRYKNRRKFLNIKTIITLIITVFTLGIITIAGVFIYFTKDLPDPSKISERKIIQSTKIYDRTGEILLYDIHGEEKRTVIPFEEIPQNLKDATIVIEDENFYKHSGFDIKGIIRAFITDIKRGEIHQGGSTISQQFIKGAILSPEKTITRKIKELILAMEMERKYSKDEILNFYLNQIPYGSNAYGVEAAAITFFNKRASELTLNESALIAALPQAPTYYSPYGNNKTVLIERKNYILERMLEKGYITDEEFSGAKEEELNFSEEYRGIKAPHFVMYVKSYLVEKYGEEMIENGGLKVITTIDWELQQKAEEILKNQVEINKKNFNAKNAALVSINPNTGEIISMIGSNDYFDIENDGNVNVTIRPRQPGSSFKPFAYAKAFEMGLTPETIIYDLKTEFNANCPTDALAEKDNYGLDCYHPQNYDLKFNGPVKIKNALAQSLNIPAVKILYIAGVNNVINMAKKMGIATLTDPKRYGLSLVLGGGEVTLLEETSAYGAFATEGIHFPHRSIIKIENGKGDILEEFKPEKQGGNKVFTPQVARQINQILSDNSLRTPTFGENSQLNMGGIVAAAKTGTTQEYRDAWTIGYTPSLVTGVWVGNNNNEKMNRAPGATVAAPIWNKFMKAALENKPIENFTEPEKITISKPILNGDFGGKSYKIDKISGKLATEWTPPNLIEEREYLEAHNILYYIDKNNPAGEIPLNPENDIQFANWEMAVLDWANKPFCFKEKRQIEGTDNFTEIEKCVIFNEEPPIEYDDIHTIENRPRINITSPENSEPYSSGDILRIMVDIESGYTISQADFFFDGKLIGGDTLMPYNFNYTIPINTPPGNYKITIKAYDSIGNNNTEEMNIKIE
jgi:1A family penicillin-binding protein